MGVTDLGSSSVGQPDAVKAVANAVRLSRSGLASQDKPLASLLFAGPSGTGKTQLSKALARFLFDSEDAMFRIDASEYSEKHSISRLIGAPPGYVGHDSGALSGLALSCVTNWWNRWRAHGICPTQALREWCAPNQFTLLIAWQSVVLIDELEKASREFTTIFLQVLDAGRLTDGQGRIVNFRNCVVIFTSNLGSHL
jgi:ATP-dependent Clp protease ATP-binding subunit ClpB